ncbi:SDR family NAD(P)-dependent oxidoreductase [Henriciella aquimarina]|uniref:SDR family NAD(P)-dependent oxidoreductase n=1 Tax=Henriciella aquimarina TaxID=545261 RepID=UPI000A02DE8C|nr:glucose 1-dehydrogenase [Henriciella aquimarina]
MAKRFEGRVVCITGAAKGIGRQAALSFAEEGAILVATDIETEPGQALVSEIEGKGGQAHFIAHDVSSEEAWIGVMADIRERHGRLDVLINNAGIGMTGLVHEMELSLWRKMMSVNVDGVFLGVKHALPLMRAAGTGNIINVSSVAGIRSTANFSCYCATKAAVRSFTKSAALECAAAQDGIRVNSIHPGIISTAIWDTLIGTSENEQDNMPRDATLAGMTAEGVPFGRTGTIQEIVNGMLFLASDESSYMTGAELVLDGGLTAG